MQLNYTGLFNSTLIERIFSKFPIKIYLRSFKKGKLKQHFKLYIQIKNE